MKTPARAAARALFTVALLLPAGCRPAAGDQEAGARIWTAGGPLLLHVEVARTPAERERGLMERTGLGEDEGMLFVYPSPRPGDAGFWMYRTQIPLDIAFIDAQKRIVALRTMEPCASADPRRCPAYLPDAAYQWALEVNAGYFARHGVGLGDRVEWVHLR